MIKLINNESSVYCRNSTEKECDKCLFIDECKDITIKIKKEKILNLQSGDELDALVNDAFFEPMPEVKSRRELGFYSDCSYRGYNLHSTEEYWVMKFPNDDDIPGKWMSTESFSTYLGGTEILIEKLQELGYELSLDISKNTTCAKLNYNGKEYVLCVGKNAPEAICKAALLAKLIYES